MCTAPKHLGDKTTAPNSSASPKLRLFLRENNKIMGIVHYGYEKWGYGTLQAKSRGIQVPSYTFKLRLWNSLWCKVRGKSLKLKHLKFTM